MVKACHLHQVFIYLFIYDNFVFGLTYITVWIREGSFQNTPFTVSRRELYEFVRPALHFSRLSGCDDDEILPGFIMFCFCMYPLPHSTSIMLDLKMWIFRVSTLYQHSLSGVVRLMHCLQLHSCRTISLPASCQTVQLRALECLVMCRHPSAFLTEEQVPNFTLAIVFSNSFVRVQTSQTHFFNICSRTLLTEKHLHSCWVPGTFFECCSFPLLGSLRKAPDTLSVKLSNFTV